MEIHDNLAIARRFIAALASPDGDPIAFYADDVVQQEFPNRLVPNGATRDLAALREGRRRGRGLMRNEEYDEHNAIASDDLVMMELTWRGTIAIDAGPFKAGQVLRARFAIVLEFRDGRIVRQRNYDCFDAW